MGHKNNPETQHAGLETKKEQSENTSKKPNKWSPTETHDQRETNKNEKETQNKIK